MVLAFCAGPFCSLDWLAIPFSCWWVFHSAGQIGSFASEVDALLHARTALGIFIFFAPNSIITPPVIMGGLPKVLAYGSPRQASLYSCSFDGLVAGK